MAHETYIGVNNIAQNVNKIWVGDNGVAKKVKRGYIGDANGIARLFFFSGYVWNRYNVNIRYRWNKNNVQQELRESGELGEGHAFCSVGQSVYYSRNYSITGNSISLLNPRRFRDERHSFMTGYYYIVGASVGNTCYLPESGGIYLSHSGPIYVLSGGSLIMYSGHSYAGSFIEYVYSSNSSAYPSNGQQGQYWYSNRIQTYSQGTYIDQVESDNPSAYPDNGRGSDGYWYVKVET